MSFAINCIIALFSLVSPDPVSGHSRAAVGDSLAVGFGHASHMTTFARVGAGSCEIVRKVPRGHYDFMLISAGTNDVPGLCLEAIRARADASTIEWVVPVNGARNHVLSVAHAHGDRLLFYIPSRRAWPHPAAYWNVR